MPDQRRVIEVVLRGRDELKGVLASVDQDLSKVINTLNRSTTATDASGAAAKRSSIDWDYYDRKIKQIDRDAESLIRTTNRLGRSTEEAGKKAASGSGIGGFLGKQFDPGNLAKAGTAALGLGSGLVAVQATQKAVAALQDVIEKTSDAYLNFERSQAAALSASADLRRELAPVSSMVDDINRKIAENDIQVGAVTSRWKLFGSVLSGVASDGFTKILQGMQEANQFIEDHPFLKGVLAGALPGLAGARAIVGTPNDTTPQNLPGFRALGGGALDLTNAEGLRQFNELLKQRTLAQKEAAREAKNAKTEVDLLREAIDKIKAPLELEKLKQQLLDAREAALIARRPLEEVVRARLSVEGKGDVEARPDPNFRRNRERARSAADAGFLSAAGVNEDFPLEATKDITEFGRAGIQAAEGVGVALGSSISAAIRGAKQDFASLGDFLKGMFAEVAASFGSLLAKLSFGSLVSGLSSLIPGAGFLKTLSSFLPKFESGGFVPRTGPAIVHEGEYILNREQVRRMSNGLSGGESSPGPRGSLDGAPAPVFNQTVVMAPGIFVSTQGGLREVAKLVTRNQSRLLGSFA